MNSISTTKHSYEMILHDWIGQEEREGIYWSHAFSYEVVPCCPINLIAHHFHFSVHLPCHAQASQVPQPTLFKSVGESDFIQDNSQTRLTHNQANIEPGVSHTAWLPKAWRTKSSRPKISAIVNNFCLRRSLIICMLELYRKRWVVGLEFIGCYCSLGICVDLFYHNPEDNRET